MNGWSKLVVAAFRDPDPGTAFDRLVQDRQIERWLAGFSLLAACRQDRTTRKEGTVLQHVRLTWLYAAANARALSEPERIMLAVLCLMHDIAKPECFAETADGRITFPQHETKAADRADDVAAWLNLGRADAQDLKWLLKTHGNAHRLLEASIDVRQRYYAHPCFYLLAHLQRANALGSLRYNSDGQIVTRPVMFARYFEDLAQLHLEAPTNVSKNMLGYQVDRLAMDREIAPFHQQSP